MIRLGEDKYIYFKGKVYRRTSWFSCCDVLPNEICFNYIEHKKPSQEVGVLKNYDYLEPMTNITLQGLDGDYYIDKIQGHQYGISFKIKTDNKTDFIKAIQLYHE